MRGMLRSRKKGNNRGKDKKRGNSYQIDYFDPDGRRGGILSVRWGQMKNGVIYLDKTKSAQKESGQPL